MPHDCAEDGHDYQPLAGGGSVCRLCNKVGPVAGKFCCVPITSALKVFLFLLSHFSIALSTLKSLFVSHLGI
jgi:hypothetical protein